MLKIVCSAIVFGMFSLILFNAYNLRAYHTESAYSVKTIHIGSSLVDVTIETGPLFKEDSP